MKNNAKTGLFNAKKIVSLLTVSAGLLIGQSASAACNGYVGITFDDGPTSNTATLISTLKQNSLTPVTWFNWGAHVASNPSMVAQEMSVGEVHNHSYTHPHLTSLTFQQIYDELNKTSQAIQSGGAPKPTVFRPPYGESNTNVQQAAQSLGMRVVTWDVDSQDWNGASTAAIVNANNQLQNGQIILMHDGYTNTNNAVAQIAANLRAKGLCPGRIDPSTGRAVAPSNSGGGASSSVRSSTSASSSSVASGGSKSVVVRAKGTGGGESISLKVGNTTVATWSLTTTMTNYTASTSATGGVLVQYTNDSTNHDVQVDYISVNGAVRQSEAQSYNTGVYQNGACGGGSGMSEMLHCNGAIGYGNL